MERPTRSNIDPIETALEQAIDNTLTDTEIGLVQEYWCLLLSGLSVREIKYMMAKDAYLMANDAVRKVNTELRRLETPAMKPKRRER